MSAWFGFKTDNEVPIDIDSFLTVRMARSGTHGARALSRLSGVVSAGLQHLLCLSSTGPATPCNRMPDRCLHHHLGGLTQENQRLLLRRGEMEMLHVRVTPSTMTRQAEDSKIFTSGFWWGVVACACLRLNFGGQERAK
jgi:hypothetical protein